MANNRLAEVAIECSWPVGTPKSKWKYPGGSRYGKYTEYLKKAGFGFKTQWGKGASCDALIRVVLHQCGLTKKPKSINLPSSSYFHNHKNSWKYLGSHVSKSKLQGGDILGTSSHVAIVVEVSGHGKCIAEAGYYSKKYPRIRTFKSISMPAFRYTKDNLGGTGEVSSGGSGKYKEYYVTKPKNFEHVKDEIYLSEQPELTQSNRVSIIEEDWGNVEETINGITVPDFSTTYDLSILSLISHYSSMLTAMKTVLSPANNLITDNDYIIFLNNYDNVEDLGLSKSVSYDGKARLENRIYYELTFEDIEDWIDLYNDLYVKWSALRYYQSAQVNYKTYFTTTEYFKGLYDQKVYDINLEINYHFTAMQNYLNNNQEKLNNSEQISFLTNEINAIQTKIFEISNQLYTKFSDLQKINKDIEKFKILKENLENFKAYFKVNNFSNIYTYWNKDIIKNPYYLNFWLEFLDTSGDLSKFSISNIGIRSQAVENNAVRSVYYKEIPNVIFYNDEDSIGIRKSGYKYFKLSNLDNLFEDSARGISAKDQIDDLLYEHSYGAEEVSLNIIPIYYLEPNTRILVYNEDTKVNNEYILNKISGNIGINPNMTLNASKAAQRLY